MALFHTNVLDPQIKALPTVSTASGSVATFDTDMTENLVEVKCQIVAQQSGSGTPSPDNVRPITTYSEMNVSHSGKNLLNLDRTNIITSDTYSNVTPRTFTSNDIWVGLTRGNYFNNSLVNSYSYTSNNVVVNTVNNAYGLGFPIRCKPNTKYVVSTSNNVNLQFGFYDISGNPLSNTQNQSFTTPNDCVWMVVIFASTSANTDTTYTNPQLELGETATAYEPFNGTTANIPFGQTIANGVLDVTTGKLRVTHGIDIYDGSSDENWNDLGGSNNGFYITNSSMNSGQFQSGMSNLFPTALNNWDIANNSIRFGANNKNIMIYHVTDTISGITDIATWKSWLANNPLQVVYPLPETTVQLDSITLQALLNENNIWCDTNGDTEAKYILSVGEALRQG